MSAARWNQIATEVNRLWAMRAQWPLLLSKGDAWVVSFDPAYLKTLPGAPENADELTYIEVPACIDGVTATTAWIPAIYIGPS